MKCVIIFLWMLSSAFAFNYGGYGNQREIRVDGNRRIFIQDSRKMVIFNVRNDEPKVIEIITKDHDRLVKIIKINDDKQVIKEITLLPGSAMVGLAPGKQKTGSDNDQQSREAKPDVNRQMNVLADIFRKYEGFVGEGSFYQLLKEIKQSVQRQELHPVIYDVIEEFEVKPTDRASTEQNEVKRNEDVEVDRTEAYGEAAKLQAPKDFAAENRQIDRSTSDQKMKLAQVLQATRQIQWIQSLLESKRKLLGDSSSSRQEDLPKNTDSFLRSSRDHINNEEDSLKETVLQIAIRELQREIIGRQMEAQQLQLQQQFLTEQKQQCKLLQQLPNTSQGQDLRKSHEQIKERMENLVDEQLRIEKTVAKLQESLIKEIEELKNFLRKENRN